MSGKPAAEDESRVRGGARNDQHAPLMALPSDLIGRILAEVAEGRQCQEAFVSATGCVALLFRLAEAGAS
jgi:hypothetical protein